MGVDGIIERHWDGKTYLPGRSLLAQLGMVLVSFELFLERRLIVCRGLVVSRCRSRDLAF